MNDTNGPIFIVAPVRSGSTFLRLMLNSHPNILNPGECDFLFEKIDDEGNFPDVSSYHEWLSQDRIFQAKELDINKKLTYSELMNSFVQQMERKNEKLSMNLHHNFIRVPSVFPKAKYIHLLRDPRDVARSCIGMGWVGNVYHGVDVWIKAEKSWDDLKENLNSEQYLEVKYENILENFEKELTSICEFIGVEYTNSMLDYAKNSTYELPDKNLSYQWKKKYSKRELQLVESKVSTMLLNRGYELSEHAKYRPSILEVLKLMLENKLFRIKVQIKVYGLALYIKNYLSKKLNILSWQKECKSQMNKIQVKGLK